MTIVTHSIGDALASLLEETQAMVSSAKTLSLNNHRGLDNYPDILNRADRLGQNISLAIAMLGKLVEEVESEFRNRPGRTVIYHVKSSHIIPEQFRPYSAPLDTTGLSTKTNAPRNPTAMWAHSRV